MATATIRPVAGAEEEAHCIELGVRAFETIPASDLSRERLFGGLVPLPGKDWRYRRAEAFRTEFARGAHASLC